MKLNEIRGKLVYVSFVGSLIIIENTGESFQDDRMMMILIMIMIMAFTLSFRGDVGLQV